jgi:hypothetical protein
MKRVREDVKESPPPLVQDLLQEVHHNLVPYGVVSPLDLLQWHSTCRAFFADWCEHAYFLRLVEVAMERNSELYEKSHHGLFFKNVMWLDTMALTEKLCRALRHVCVVGLCHAKDLRQDCETLFYDDSWTVERLLGQIDDKRIDTTRAPLPDRFGSVFKRANSYMIARCGWEIEWDEPTRLPRLTDTFNFRAKC